MSVRVQSWLGEFGGKSFPSGSVPAMPPDSPGIPGSNAEAVLLHAANVEGGRRGGIQLDLFTRERAPLNVPDTIALHDFANVRWHGRAHGEPLRFGCLKQGRDDYPVITLALDGSQFPCRCETLPGNASEQGTVERADQDSGCVRRTLHLIATLPPATRGSDRVQVRKFDATLPVHRTPVPRSPPRVRSQQEDTEHARGGGLQPCARASGHAGPLSSVTGRSVTCAGLGIAPRDRPGWRTLLVYGAPGRGMRYPMRSSVRM